MPDTADPQPPAAEEHDTPDARSEISMEDYHQHADNFFDSILVLLEARNEEKGDVDAEYAVSVSPHYRWKILMKIG
jgi:hypothetical protein